MKSSSGSIIVISNSNKLSLYLDGLMITNVYFRNLDDFNRTYGNFPLTANKVLVFESGIVNLESIKKFSDIIKDDLSQVSEILFLVSADFREYFQVALDSFSNKKFLSEDVTYKKLEALITESKSYELKSEVELVDVIQRKKKAERRDDKIDRFQTRVTIDRKRDNNKISRELELLDRDVDIVEGGVFRSEAEKTEFNYLRLKSDRGYKSNNILMYDSGFNAYKILTSEYAKGRRLLILDYSDSMFFSFLVENDKNISKSMLLEDIYSEGAFSENIKDFMINEDLCIVRNSYNLKKALQPEDMENLIKFIIGRYGNSFDCVFILVDDLKVNWAGTIRYIILPPTIDYLMKFVNFIDRESIVSNYVKLGGKTANSEFVIGEQAVRNYLTNLGINNVKIVGGNLEDDETYTNTYLFDLVRLETGETVESLTKERRLKSK